MNKKFTPFKRKTIEELLEEDKLDENLARQRKARAEFNKQFKSVDEFMAFVMKEDEDDRKAKAAAKGRAVERKGRTRARGADGQKAKVGV